MAKVENSLTEVVHGKLNKKDNRIYRTKNGKQHVYSAQKPTVPASKAQNAMRQNFGKVNKVVNAIMCEPLQVKEWKQKMDEYNSSVAFKPGAKKYITVRQFVFATISAQLALKQTARRRRNPFRGALPKGLKLHVKHFTELTTTELYEIFKARFSVFVIEQNCHYLDMDDIDYSATHIALFRKGKVIAYARLFPGTKDGEWIVGRMLTVERKKGYGVYLMERVEAEAIRQGATTLLMHAQTHAVPFYAKLGFKTFGTVFTEADMPHIEMKKELNNNH